MAEQADEVVPPSHHRTIKLEVKDEIGGLGASESLANGRPGVYFLKGCRHLCIDVLAAVQCSVGAV